HRCDRFRMLPLESELDLLRVAGSAAPRPGVCPVRTPPPLCMCSPFARLLRILPITAQATPGRKCLVFGHDDLAFPRPNVVSVKHEDRQRNQVSAVHRSLAAPWFPGDVFFRIFGFRSREQEGWKSYL